MRGDRLRLAEDPAGREVVQNRVRIGASRVDAEADVGTRVRAAFLPVEEGPGVDPPVCRGSMDCRANAPRLTLSGRRHGLQNPFVIRRYEDVAGRGDDEALLIPVAVRQPLQQLQAPFQPLVVPSGRLGHGPGGLLVLGGGEAVVDERGPPVVAPPAL